MTQIDELLRETANAVGRDDEAERRAIDRARRALHAAVAAAASQDLSQPRAKRRNWGMRPPRRAAGLSVALAGAAAAAVVAAVVAPGGDNVVHPAPAAAAILRRAADVVPTGMPADPSPGQYLYTQVKWITPNPTATPPTSTGTTTTPIPTTSYITQVFDTWENQRGGVQTRSGTDVDPQLRWMRLGPDGGELGPYPYTQLEQLPTSRSALGTWVAHHSGAGAVKQRSQAWINHESWITIHDILIGQLVPAKLREALYRVAATIPGVTSLGLTKDAAGRDALAITFNDPLYSERDELLFDPQTYLLAGESIVNTKTGQIQESEAVMQSQIVNSIPQSVLSAAPDPSKISGLSG